MAEEDTIEDGITVAMETTLTREQFAAVIASLGSVGGPEGVTVDDDGVAEIGIDDRPTTLLHQPPVPAIAISAPVLDEGELSHALLLALLKANGDWSLTGGGTFSLAGPEGPLVYSRRVMLMEPTPERVMEALVAFTDWIEQWESACLLELDAQALERAETAEPIERPTAILV